jgi:hypothetical protein
MFSELLVSALLLTPAISQTQKNQAPVTPQQAPLITMAPPIKMGLWEAAITTAMGTSLKTRSCMTAQSYRDDLAHLPAGCTLSNVQTSSSSMSADVSCTLPDGASSSGHINAQFPDTSTAHATISVTTTMQGRTMPMTITTESHFVSSDCGDIQPGQSKVIR